MKTQFTAPDGKQFTVEHRRRGSMQLHLLSYFDGGSRTDSIIFEPDDPNEIEYDVYVQSDEVIGTEPVTTKMPLDEALFAVAFWDMIAAQYCKQVIA